MSTPAIEAVDLVKVYASGTRALGGITFAIDPGEIFGLLGPNGSGKTTAVRIFVTLLQATSGQARIAGFTVNGDRRRVRELIGYAGQYVGVDGDLTVVENLVQSGRLHGLTARESRGRADAVIGELGLGGTAGVRASRLSGGMRRRLDLAQAIVHSPAVLFLDEPTTGLDPQARNALWDVLRSLSADGTTILLTTQYLEEADRLCDRVAILDRGQVLTIGSPAALKDAAGDDRVTLTLERSDELEQHALTWRVAAETPGVMHVSEEKGAVVLRIRGAAETLPSLMRELDANGVSVDTVRLVPTTLDDVFVAYTGDRPRSEVVSGRRPTSVFAAIHGGR